MKVTVLQENLARGLSIVSRAVSPRSTLPVLSNILIASDEGRLRLSATNLELGITCWIAARIDEEGVARARCFDLDAASLDVPELEDMPPPPAAAGQILLCLKPGFFLCRDRDRFTVWNLRRPRCVRVLWEGKGVYLADAQDDTVYLVRPREILVLDGCLKGVA